jgi:O-antigen ligase
VPSGRLPARIELTLLVLLGLPAAAALGAHGGFFSRGQTAFVVVTAGATVGVVAVAGWAGAVLRSPAVLALAGLAALSALSATWTIASPGDALRWAAVIGALVLIALAASIVSGRVGATGIAALIAVLAAGAGLVGLYGAGARVEPLAQRLGGQWSAGGPLEYSPALALMQVSALPVLMAAMAIRRDRLAVGAASGAAIAGAVVALSGSRVELAIGMGVAIACALTARRAIGVSTAVILSAAALAGTAGGVADAVAGSYVRPYVTGGDAPRLLALAAIVAAAGGLWLAQRRALRAAGTRSRRARAIAAGMVILPLAAALIAAGLTPDSGPQAEPVSGFTHGRLEQWEAAVDAAADRPLAGSGSLSFYEASAAYQEPPPVRFAHNLPLENWVELGVAGALLTVVLYLGSAAAVWLRRRTAAAWLLGPAVLGFLLANLFDWPWHLPASGAVFALSLGALVGLPPGDPPRGESNERA